MNALFPHRPLVFVLLALCGLGLPRPFMSPAAAQESEAIARNVAEAADQELPPDWLEGSPMNAEDPRITFIDQILKEEARKGFSGVILIRRGDEVLLHQAYGYADTEAAVPMTIDHGFDIGSLVKSFTAVGFLKLVEEGRLTLGRRLDQYFPQAPSDKAGITLLQLLTHTSGMQDALGGDYELVRREAFVEKAMAAPLRAEPGSEQLYSNSGYSLLAVVLEQVTGLPYEQWVRREVLLPAGTERIGYRLAGWTRDQLAVGYFWGGERWGTPLDHAWAPDGPSWNLRGNGGMLATVEGVHNWYHALLEGRIVGEQALGLFLDQSAGQSRSVGGLTLDQSGGNDVFKALHIAWIDRDIHWTFFTNRSDFQADLVWQLFRDQLVSFAKGEPAEQVNRDTEAAATRGVILRLLQQDARLSGLRNRDSETMPLHVAIDRYTTGMEALDLEAPPPAFRRALSGHVEAWKEMSRFLRDFSDLRGPMHVLFGQLEENATPSATFRRLRDAIWETWSEVEVTAQKFGVTP